MNTQRSVLVFSVAYEPYVGGAEVAIREIAARSQRSFTVVTVRFSHTDAKRERIGNVDIIRVGPMWLPASLRKIAFIPVAAWTGWRMRRNISFAWGMMANYAGISSWLYSRITGQKLLLTLQEGDDMDALLRRPSMRITMPVFRDLFRRATRIQCISKYLCTFAERFASKDKISLVPNGVDLDRFELPELEKVRSASRDELGIHHNAKVLVTSSRLVSKNGIDRVIRALPLMDEVEFVIFGEGPDEDSMRALARSLGVLDRVHFKGFQTHQDLPRLMAAGNAFVRLSRTEGLGNSFIEAMAMKVPVICTAVGGIVDFARDGDTAIVCVAPDDPVRTAADMMRAFEDSAAGIAQRGCDLARTKYGWSVLVRSMEEEFLRVAEESEKNSVLIATGIFPPDVGGPATHAGKISKAFVTEGRSVKVVCFGESETERSVDAKKEDGVCIVRVSRRAARLMVWYRYARELVRAARQSDVVYAFDVTTAGLPAAVYCKLSHKPLLVRVGGDPTWERTVERGERFISFAEYFERNLDRVDRPILRRIVRFVLRTAKHVSVDHVGMRNHVIERYGVHPSNVTVVANPCDTAVSNVAAAREPFVVLYAGRIVSYKNLPNLVRAMAIVRTQIPQAQLRIVGAGPALAEFRNVIVDAGSTVDVVVEPSVPHEKLLEIIDASSVVVMPAITEFNPNVALDALARMRPVVISQGSGLSRPVPVEWTFNPTSPASIAESIVYIYNNFDTAISQISTLTPAPTWSETLARHSEFVDSALKNESEQK